MFQQYSAPAPEAELTKDWMADLPNYITPNMGLPNLPDLNPIDYYMCSMVEWKINQHSHKVTDSLKAAITSVTCNINTDHVLCAYQQI